MLRGGEEAMLDAKLFRGAVAERPRPMHHHQPVSRPRLAAFRALVVSASRFVRVRYREWQSAMQTG